MTYYNWPSRNTKDYEDQWQNVLQALEESDVFEPSDCDNPNHGHGVGKPLIHGLVLAEIYGLKRKTYLPTTIEKMVGKLGIPLRPACTMSWWWYDTGRRDNDTRRLPWVSDRARLGGVMHHDNQRQHTCLRHLQQPQDMSVRTQVRHVGVFRLHANTRRLLQKQHKYTNKDD